MRNTARALVAIVAFFGFDFAANARAEDLYKGKTIRFIVGFAAGGGYDAYARTVGRYIGRHIPGNPSITVENMDGAGSVIATNYMYNKAEKDGLTVGIWNSHNVFNHMMGDSSLRIDGRKFGWIGSPAFDTWNSPNEFARPFSLPPGAPREALSILRRAFKATMEDRDYRKDAEKSKLTVEPTAGEQIERHVERIYSVTPEVKKRLQFLFKKHKTS
jgi:tripartite-type tricarboxylate transporter receptor subunit TctC